jgi:hypothetical protein
VRLAGLALLLLGCGSPSFSATDRETGGKAGMGGDDAGKGGSSGESAGSGGTVSAGTGGTNAGSGGEAKGGAGMSTGGAGVGGMAAGVGGVAGELVSAGMGGTAGGLAGAGAGGAEQCGLPHGSPGYKTIDDLEDGDGIVGNGDGDPVPPARYGIWSAGNSSPGLCLQTTGDVTPEEDDDGNLFIGTSGFDCAEAWIGFELHRCDGAPEPYDVSSYVGLTFRYQSSSVVRVVVVTDATRTMSESHGMNFVSTADYPGVWTTANVTWESFRFSDNIIGDPPAPPQLSGEPHEFDPKRVLEIRFVTSGDNFELLVDDIEFL